MSVLLALNIGDTYNICDILSLFLPRDATQSAVMPQYDVCPSVSTQPATLRHQWRFDPPFNSLRVQ